MGTQNQDQGKQQNQGTEKGPGQQQNQGNEKRPGQQQGANQPGGRQPGQDQGGQQGNRQQGGTSQAGNRQQEQQGDRQRERVAKDEGVSTDDIDERDDAGSLGQKGTQNRTDKTR